VIEAKDAVARGVLLSVEVSKRSARPQRAIVRAHLFARYEPAELEHANVKQLAQSDAMQPMLHRQHLAHRCHPERQRQGPLELEALASTECEDIGAAHAQVGQRWLGRLLRLPRRAHWALTWLDVTWLDVTWLDVTGLDVTWLDVTGLDVTWLGLRLLPRWTQLSSEWRG